MNYLILLVPVKYVLLLDLLKKPNNLRNRSPVNCNATATLRIVMLLLHTLELISLRIWNMGDTTQSWKLALPCFLTEKILIVLLFG